MDISFQMQKNYLYEGSGFGSVGRAVTSSTRGPQFESKHWQNFIQNLHLLLAIKKRIKKKSLLKQILKLSEQTRTHIG